jgi:hypothetical protein
VPRLGWSQTIRHGLRESSRRAWLGPGVAPALKLIIQSASSWSDALIPVPLISRNVNMATSAVCLLPSMNC